jgi:hypothetical protein
VWLPISVPQYTDTAFHVLMLARFVVLLSHKDRPRASKNELSKTWLNITQIGMNMTPTYATPPSEFVISCYQ